MRAGRAAKASSTRRMSDAMLSATLSGDCGLALMVHVNGALPFWSSFRRGDLRGVVGDGCSAACAPRLGERERALLPEGPAAASGIGTSAAVGRDMAVADG